MAGKSCFFIGHRDTPDDILPLLADAVEHHIAEYNVTEFIVGRYGSFDRIAAQAVMEAKVRHPEITLLMLIPYHPAERQINVPKGFDNTYYPPGMEKIPHRVAIVRANQHMISQVDYLIAYAWHPASSARDLLEFAEKQARNTALKIVNLAQPPQGLYQR